METLGVSTKVIPAKELSTKRPVRAIHALSDDYDTISKTTRMLSEKLRGENGLSTAVSEIDKIIRITGTET